MDFLKIGKQVTVVAGLGLGGIGIAEAKDSRPSALQESYKVYAAGTIYNGQVKTFPAPDGKGTITCVGGNINAYIGTDFPEKAKGGHPEGNRTRTCTYN